MTVIAAALRELMIAGLDGDDLVAAIERIELAQRSAKSGAERQAAYRARKEAAKAAEAESDEVTSDASDVTNVTPKQPCPPSFPPNPQTTPLNPPMEGAKKRGRRIPDDWQPTDEGRELATSLGIDPDAEAEKFRDHWQAKSGKDAAKLDWDATWRNWVKRAAEFKPKPRAGDRGQSQPSGLLPSTDWRARLWDRRKGRCWMPGDFWPPGWGDDPTKNRTIPKEIYDEWRAAHEAEKEKTA